MPICKWGYGWVERMKNRFCGTKCSNSHLFLFSNIIPQYLWFLLLFAHVFPTDDYYLIYSINYTIYSENLFCLMDDFHGGLVWVFDSILHLSCASHVFFRFVIEKNHRSKDDTNHLVSLLWWSSYCCNILLLVHCFASFFFFRFLRSGSPKSCARQVPLSSGYCWCWENCSSRTGSYENPL